jgi:hypothetical protein
MPEVVVQIDGGSVCPLDHLDHLDHLDQVSYPLYSHSSGLLVNDKDSLAISSNQGAPWSDKSKMSRSFVSSPEASILSFSHTCGSAVKGANPSVRHSTINRGRGIRFIRLRILKLHSLRGV